MPLPYRVVFIILDILLPLYGIYSNLLDSHSILALFTPSPTLPPAPETQLLLDGGAGWFAMLLVLNVALLRYRPNDIFVWKVLQASVLWTDVAMVGGFVREMNGQGRLWEMEKWRGLDYGNVCGYGVIAALRFGFVMGIGLGEPSEVGLIEKGKGKGKSG